MPATTVLDRLRQVSTAYQESCILAAAAELDLFTSILEHNNQLSAQKIAEISQTDLRAITVLLDALSATGYLVKSDLIYSVAAEFRELLDSRNQATFVPLIRHMVNVQRAWTQIARTVKDGTRPEVQPSILGADQDRVSFIWAMNSIAGTLVGPTVETLKKAHLLTFDNFIDIGGASGTYTQTFLQALPKSEGTIFDLPVGIAAARERFVGSEFEHRVQLVEGDFAENELPSGFDFAWISAIIHQFDRTGSRELYKKVFKSLNPGGTAAVRDFMMNTDRTAPKDGALFGINMLVETPTGMVYTFDEVKADLESVGFTEVNLAVPAETMSAIVVAQKPRK